MRQRLKAHEIGPETIRDWLGNELNISSAFGMHVRRVAPYVFRVWGESLPTSFAVKLCCNSETGELSCVEADVQYRSLAAAGTCLEVSADHSVAKTFPFLKGRACLVTEWVNGQALNQYWQDWRKTRHQLVESAARAGDWLRSFHDCRRLPDCPLAVAQMMERLHGLHEAADRGFRSSPVVNAGIRLLDEVARENRNLEIATSWLHGDFKPANLVLAEPAVVGIDLSVCHEGAVVHDIAPFLLELNLMCLEPMTCRLSRIRAEMKGSFLAGYSRRSPFPWHLALAWTMLHLALCIWAARESRETRTMRNWFLRKRLQFILPRLIRGLKIQRGQT